MAEPQGELHVTRDGIYYRVPEGVDPAGPEAQALVNSERLGRRKRHMETPEFKAKVAAQQAQDRETYDPTVGMSGLDKVRANYGAGVDSLWQGIKQVVPGLKGASDDDIREKRARDANLAEKTDLGVGADWMPTAGKALQFAGENSTALIPAGAGASIGMKVLPKALGATALRAGITEGALGGGVMGALQPTTSDESRTLNTGFGAAAGAALPAAIGAAKGVRNYVTGRGARAAAAERLGVKPDTPTPADPAALAVRGAEDVPLSTAATYSDPALAVQELAARGRQAPEWSGFDQAQKKALWENVEKGTQRAGTEGEARATRAGLWRTNTADAMKAAKPKVWESEMPQLRANLEQALRSPQGQNEMRPVLNEIIRQMDELGAEFSPQHLAALRSRMAGKVRGSPNDPFTSAPMSDPAYISLKKEFDDILNATTGNKWQRVVDGYREASVPVAQAKAESLVKGRFMTPEGMPRTTASEGVPSVTENALRGAVTKPQVANRGTSPTFAPESERVLKGTLEALERQNILGRVKGTGTGGGGSYSIPLATSMAKAVDPTGGFASKAIGMAAQYAKHLGDRRVLAELDQALIDPKKYYALVVEAIKAGQPLSPAQRIAYELANKAAQGATVGGTEEAIQPPR